FQLVVSCEDVFRSAFQEVPVPQATEGISTLDHFLEARNEESSGLESAQKLCSESRKLWRALHNTGTTTISRCIWSESRSRENFLPVLGVDAAQKSLSGSPGRTLGEPGLHEPEELGFHLQRCRALIQTKVSVSHFTASPVALRGRGRCGVRAAGPPHSTLPNPNPWVPSPPAAEGGTGELPPSPRAWEGDGPLPTRKHTQVMPAPDPQAPLDQRTELSEAERLPKDTVRQWCTDALPKHGGSQQPPRTQAKCVGGPAAGQAGVLESSYCRSLAVLGNLCKGPYMQTLGGTIRDLQYEWSPGRVHPTFSPEDSYT
ncbi:PREDICTED: uncharacterized protein C14orf79 homolog, partial [Bison bison bison]|uniref:Uncharacterized protein C14orf79 homolog n=1 Tax=Bison bison bison TaxID=43346 RepID=A0A6P3J578_BISBB